MWKQAVIFGVKTGVFEVCEDVPTVDYEMLESIQLSDSGFPKNLNVYRSIEAGWCLLQFSRRFLYAPCWGSAAP